MRELILAALRQAIGSPSWKDYIRGEWWLDQDGTSTFADSDVGEAGHERIALEHFIGSHDDEFIEKLVESGVPQEKLNNSEDLMEYYFTDGIPNDIGEAVLGKELWQEIKADVRYAYAKHTNSILVIDLNFMAYKITTKTISGIQNFLLDESHGEEMVTEDSSAMMMVEEVSTKKSVELPVNDFLLLKYPSELWRTA